MYKLERYRSTLDNRPATWPEIVISAALFAWLLFVFPWLLYLVAP